jgi:hypothetical protein
MCLTLSKKFYIILLFWVRYKITHQIESKFEIEDVDIENDIRIKRIIDSAFIISREMQSSRIAVASQSITENVFYSNVRVNRRNFLFDARSQTNNSQRERSIYIDIERDLIFWMKNVSNKLLKMIKIIKKKNRNLIKNYNDQIDVIDEYFTKRNEYLEKKKLFRKKTSFFRTSLLIRNLFFARWDRNWKHSRQFTIEFAM